MNSCQKCKEQDARSQPISCPQSAANGKVDAAEQEPENNNEAHRENVRFVRAIIERPTAVVPVWVEPAINHVPNAPRPVADSNTSGATTDNPRTRACFTIASANGCSLDDSRDAVSASMVSSDPSDLAR